MRNDDLIPIPCPHPGHSVSHRPGRMRELPGPNLTLTPASRTAPGPEDCESAPGPAWTAGAPWVLNDEC